MALSPSDGRRIASLSSRRTRVWWKILGGGRFARAWAIACCLAVPAAAQAQTLMEAVFDAGNDALSVEIAYRGTHPNHEFSLDWSSCQQTPDGKRTTVARLVDGQGDDVAREDYRVRRSFSLAALECRPADVTVRLGPVSNRTVHVPARSR
jgi:hypothetical protein